MKLTVHVLWSAMVIGVSALTGCESAQQAGGLQQAIDDYNAQKYTQARDRAESIGERAKPGVPGGGVREDAAYIAGLSSYQLGDTDEAERQFTIAANSADEDTAARAKAMLGQVRLDQRRPREAATLFSDCYTSLDGPDSRKAALNAAIAYQQAGDMPASKKWLDIANGVPTAVPIASSSPKPVSGGAAASPSAPAGVGFTLQVGAFKDKERAKRAADDAEKLAQREGLGGVRMMLRRDERGMPTYLVQFGSFPTRDAAAAMRSKLGRLEYIVTATGGSAS